jgi:hypothetical protein
MQRFSSYSIKNFIKVLKLKLAMLSIWAGFSSLWAQHYQKGYNEEEPA